jgi:acyl carrier protein
MASQLDFKELQELSAEILGIDADQVQMDKSFQRDLAADSLDLVELIAAIEDKYDVELSDEQLEKMKVIADLWKYLQERPSVWSIAFMAITTNYRAVGRGSSPLLQGQGQASAIAGVGVYAPEKVISNFDSKMMDTRQVDHRANGHPPQVSRSRHDHFRGHDQRRTGALEAARSTPKTST